MKNSHTLFVVLVLSTILGACKVAEKDFRSGNYDDAINVCVGKLIKNPGKEDYALLLEEAFKRANTQDLERIKSLNLEGQPNRWEDIYNTYQSISRRQHKIEPLVPLEIKSENREAQFSFIDVVAEISNAKKNAAQFWYADASEKLRYGNKYDARDAYNSLLKIKSFFDNYKDVNDMINEAKEAGLNNVMFITTNNSDKLLSATLDKALKNIKPKTTTGEWYTIYTQPKTDMAYPYSILLSVNQLDAFPEKSNTNRYEETKQIEDGFTYTYDTNGNVLKDSLGNDIKITKYKTVTAYVIETWQEKAATVSGTVKYTDNTTGEIFHTEPIKADAVFRNYYATATGYYEALSQQSKEKLGGKPVPYPPDEIMLKEAIDLFDDYTQNVLENLNDTYLNR